MTVGTRSVYTVGLCLSRPFSAGPIPVWRQFLIVAGFLALPVVWGVAVNKLFDLWNGRDEDETDDGIFPDYQI